MRHCLGKSAEGLTALNKDIQSSKESSEAQAGWTIAEDQDDADDEDDEDDEYEADQEDDVDHLLVELIEVFLEFVEVGDDMDQTQDAVLKFAATATHIHLYNLVENARRENQDPQKAALEWIQAASGQFASYLTDADFLRAAGALVGEPELRINFDRKFRRRL